MKNIYAARHFLAFFSFFYCCSVSVFGQSNPAVQTLPYKQDFTALAHTATAYPAGFQGWIVNAAANTTTYYAGFGAAALDRNLIASSNANTNSGNIHNYNGKIGFLDTTTADFAIGFAFSTEGQTDIGVQYDAMVIRNPYDGTSANNRLQEMALQYRVGTSGAFSTLLPATAYLSGTVTQTGTGITTPQNSQTIKVVLPTDCNNQPVVQIRWIARLQSGTAGARQSFAIDNIDIRSIDVTPPVTEAGYPKTTNIFGDGFDFSNKLNELGKTYYVLLPGGSATPTIAQIKAGLDANNAAALQSGFLDITDKTQEYVKSFAGLTLSTAYSVFSVSEDSSGNVQTSVVQVDATTTNVLPPVLSTAIASLDLGISEANFSAETKSYQIQATNLTNDVVLTSSANFTISKDNTSFGSSLTFTVAELAAAQTVYVQFTPNAVGNFSGEIKHESIGAKAKSLALSGIGIDPYKQGFNDVNVLTNSGWTQYDVAGNLNKWSQTITTRNVNTGTGAVLANGYSDAGASKDWLISPRLRLNNFTNIPLLSFYSRKFYDGPGLKLMVSVDYDGKSNPTNFNWTEINGKFPTATGVYVQSEFIDLSAYKTDHTYVAWVYETTAGGTNNAAEWSLDDVLISNETSYVDSKPNLDFGDLNVGNVSASQPFIFKAVGYNDITLAVSANFELSLDNITFQSSVIVSETEAAAVKTIYARFVPAVKQLTISGPITITGTSLNKQIGSLTGSSIPKADTFDIVSYNLEFFGSNVIGSDGKEFGPTDDALQIENVATVMNKLNADVYVVQEVSDEPSLDILIQKISINGKTFDKTISTSWSYSYKAPEANFPPQKLVVLYNTQTTTVKKTRVMFKKLFDQVIDNSVTLAGYPDTDDDGFFASGRLPYMVTMETNIGGIKKEINVIDLHARANSGSDISKYNQRKYDIDMLTDSLNVYYPNTNFMILGDYNDDVKKSVVGTNPSSYEKMVNDKDHFTALTLDISIAGANSYFNFTPESFLDHIIISNELKDQYILNSVAVYDPRNDISNYTTTTSDHGPIIARFELKADNLSVKDFENKNGYTVKAYPNPATDQVNIVVKTEENKNLKLKLYDMNGRAVRNAVEINSGQDKSTTQIPLDNLQSGIYIYTLTENNKVIYSNKIIKK